MNTLKMAINDIEWVRRNGPVYFPNNQIGRFFVKLLTLGFCTNHWIWFHILIGALGARFFLSVCHFSPQVTMIIVVSVALLWEGLEAAMQPIKRIYGSWSRFLFDSAGDVLGAVIAAGIVVI